MTASRSNTMNETDESTEPTAPESLSDSLNSASRDLLRETSTALERLASRLNDDADKWFFPEGIDLVEIRLTMGAGSAVQGPASIVLAGKNRTVFPAGLKSSEGASLSGRSGREGLDKQGAAKYAVEHAQSSPTGLCAKYVRVALK